MIQSLDVLFGLYLEEIDKYNTFKSVVGYLLHTYKTSSKNKAIILNDETI